MLKVGDEVRVREDLSHENNYGIDGEMTVDSNMENYCGEMVTITEVVNSDAELKYHINKDSEYWYWTEDMFEPHMYSTGDIVTVKENLEIGFSYGSDTFVEGMEDNCGKTFCIASVKANEKYKLCDMTTGEILPHNYTSEMFVKGEEKEMDAVEERVIAQFPEINVPDRDDSEYIERCIELEISLYETYSCRDDMDAQYPYNVVNVRKANNYSNERKKKLNDLFSRHPLWNNKLHSIVMDCNLERCINRDDIDLFFSWIKYNYLESMEEEKIDGQSFSDFVRMLESFYRIRRAYSALLDDQICNSNICDMTYDAVKIEIAILEEKYHLFQEEHKELHDRWVSKNDYKSYRALCNLLDSFFYEENFDQFVTESYMENIDKFEKETEIKLNAVKGKKVSRVINTLCVALELNKIKDIKTTYSGREYDDGYNRQFAKFADAINPITYNQKVIIATDRIAFLTASLGHKWTSCYTMDKYNIRDDGSDNYSGAYSGGTTSYGSDKTTFVLYTIKNDYEGEPTLTDKINRCFFSLGEGKIIQSRNYPDGRDGGDNSLAKQFREIVQKVVSECYDIPNLWVTKKGTDECQSVITYDGAGYRDHICYSDCNVSYWKGENDFTILNTNKIVLGSKSICPSCGSMTDYNECVVCYSCQEDAAGCIECYECGSECDAEDMVEIDGNYYCTSCAFYCEYHGEWEVGEYTYIRGYGHVCDFALDVGGFSECKQCGDYFYNDDGIFAYDGTPFCCDECAEAEDYVICNDDGEYRSVDDAHYCDECGSYYSEDAFNKELGMCDNCAEKKSEDAETEVA